MRRAESSSAATGCCTRTWPWSTSSARRTRSRVFARVETGRLPGALREASRRLAVKAPLFAAGAFRASEMREADIPRVQAFLEANPEYDLAVNGAPPGPGAAREEFDSLPPADFRYDK